MNDAITWRYLPLGEAALLVEGQPVTPLVNRYVLALAAQFAVTAHPNIETVVPAINSLLITFDPLHVEHTTLAAQVAPLLEQLMPMPEQPERVIEIQVQYGGNAGPDLIDVARQLAISPEQVVALHTAGTYRVMMIGFAPGFPYIGPLPDLLLLPRRATPRTAVPPGSVAIAAGLTGIYPACLPGGWHLIGRTDVALFDPFAASPTLLVAGDGVRFTPRAGGVML